MYVSSFCILRWPLLEEKGGVKSDDLDSRESQEVEAGDAANERAVVLQ